MGRQQPINILVINPPCSQTNLLWRGTCWGRMDISGIARTRTPAQGRYAPAMQQLQQSYSSREGHFAILAPDWLFAATVVQIAASDPGRDHALVHATSLFFSTKPRKMCKIWCEKICWRWPLNRCKIFRLGLNLSRGK